MIEFILGDSMKNMNRKRFGFTLVELIGVIVIIAILITIATPPILEVINGSKKSAFNSYVDKLRMDIITRYESDTTEDPNLKRYCLVYDITKDLDLAYTDEYEGFIVVVPSVNEPKYYFNIHNSRFMVVNFNYETDTFDRATKRYVSTGSKGFVSNIDEYAKDALNCYNLKKMS